MAANVSIGGFYVSSIANWNDTYLETTLPIGVGVGLYVNVINSANRNSSANNLFSYNGKSSSHSTVCGLFTIYMLADPVINTVTPSSGVTGINVTITGTGYGSTTGTVWFGASPYSVQATVRSWSDTAVVVTVPAAAGNTATVLLANSASRNGTNSFAYAGTYFLALASLYITAATRSS